MSWSWLEWLANTALCVLAVQMVVFTGTYILGSRWWTTSLGRVYSAKSLLLSLVLLQNAASSLSNQDYPGRNWVRLAIYSGGAIAMIAMWLILLRYQRQGRTQRRKAGVPDD